MTAVRAALLLLAVLAACTRDSRAGAGDGRTPLVARVDSLVAGYREETGAPGVSVAVVRAGRDTLVLRAYGLADVEHRAPATPATVFGIGSVTKQFTAAAVLALAEDGRLSLDDPIEKHLRGLREVPAGWRAVRVRHLLNHTSGVPEINRAGGALLAGDLVPDMVLARLSGQPLEFAPGSRWSYSNTGYVLLGMIVEAAAEEPFPYFVESQVLGPLRMSSTRFCRPDRVIPHRASGYLMNGDELGNAPRAPYTALNAAGGLCSTAGDLAAWNRALATGQVVGAAWVRRMFTAEGPAASVGSGYGYGVARLDLGGRTALGHGGSFGGFRAANLYLPSDSVSVTVLTNIELRAPGSGPDALALNVARATVGLPLRDGILPD